MKLKYKAMVLSCMDPRFQPIVYNYLKKKNLIGKYSAFTIAGSAIGVTASKFKKWHKTFWDNIDTSIKLHKIKKLIVINHRDCGAAKIINGKKEFNKNNETKIHKNSFLKLKKIFRKKYPQLTIELKLISLNLKVENFR
ncbi:carbonic anhydrase [Candidatus Pelagibacter bacterium]|nr:carbonic anhydrase [Candidatus Pelagibacter bacterium]|tara:strand:- start:317 stop:733 length:417 start_codon:yes stop_codon:yes gene_type:complete